MGFELEQCCGSGYEIDGIVSHNNIREAIIGKDIVCTDSLPSSVLGDFRGCQITAAIMKMANEGAILNPCPPFYRGEEVSDDVIESDYFVDYEFKKYLLDVQQTIIILCWHYYKKRNPLPIMVGHAIIDVATVAQIFATALIPGLYETMCAM